MAIIPHLKYWTTRIYNANDGKRDLQCVGRFYLDPHHDGLKVRQKLPDVALTGPQLNKARPVGVVVKEEDWGTHYRIRAYPIEPGSVPVGQRPDGAGQDRALGHGVTLGWRSTRVNNPPKQ